MSVSFEDVLKYGQAAAPLAQALVSLAGGIIEAVQHTNAGDAPGALAALDQALKMAHDSLSTLDARLEQVNAAASAELDAELPEPKPLEAVAASLKMRAAEIADALVPK